VASPPLVLVRAPLHQRSDPVVSVVARPRVRSSRSRDGTMGVRTRDDA